MKRLLNILFLIIVSIAYSQDGRSLILIHNYTNKTNIDGIANLTEGNIAYNQEDNSIYVYNGTKWIVDSYYKGITITSAAVPLDENNYTVIIEADILTTLPLAGNNIGREFVFKNTTNNDVSISDYNDNTNTISTTIPANNVLKVQSDGTTWHQVNNYPSPIIITPTTPTLPLDPIFSTRAYDDTGGNGAGTNDNKELEIDYGNGSAPSITELQILFTDYPFSEFIIDELKIRNRNIILDDIGSTADDGQYTTINTELNTNGTGYNHLITIDLSGTGIVIQDGDIIDLDFDIVGSDGTNDANNITYFSN